MLGNAIDVPYSPVRLIILMLDANASIELVEIVRTAAGLAYAISLLSLVIFVLLVRIAKWPSKSGAFNVWVNLPLFDPTGGGDVLVRLKRDSSINIIFGFLLPFLIPAVVKTATDLVGNLTMDDPQTLIWTISAWAFLPASMIMRGIAMGRVAEMIEGKTPSRLRSIGCANRLIFLTGLLLCPFVGAAEGFRVATFHAELTRKGPGILLRDIERDKDKQIAALKQLVKAVDPNVLFLTKVDF